MFERLRKFSFDTVFGVDTLSSAATQLLQTGTAVDTLETRLTQLGNISGGSTSKFNDLVAVFAKIQNLGKAGSLQLQQLSLMGIPIMQTLKEMGVAGTATSEQIVEAFEKMTAEGGMFNNAMQSIIDTIEGKEGYISDTIREIGASFAEASGLAGAYKAYLDTMKNAVQGIQDVLSKINSNPLYQALFRGVVVGVIVGLASAIMSALIPALIATATNLGIIAALGTVIKAMINPVGLLIGLLAGGAVALGSYLISERKATTETERHNQAIEAQIQLLRQLDFSSDPLGNTQVEYDASSKLFDEINAKVLTYVNDIRKAQDENEKLAKKIKLANDILGNSPAVRQMADEYIARQNRIAQLEKERQTYVDMLAASEQNMNASKTALQFLTNVSSATESLGKILPTNDTQQKIVELKKQLVEVQKMEKLSTAIPSVDSNGNFTYKTGLAVDVDNSFKDSVNKAKKYLTDQIGELTVKLRLEGFEQWQRVMQSAYGFNDKRAVEFIGASNGGHKATQEYISDLNKQMEYTQQYFDIIGKADIKSQSNEIEILKNAIDAASDALRKLFLSGEYSTSDNSIKDLSTYIKKLQGLLDDKEKADLYTKTLTNLNKEYELLGKSNVERLKAQNLAKGMSEYDAQSLASIQDYYDTVKQLANGNYINNMFNEMGTQAAYNYNKNGRRNLNAGQYAVGIGGQALVQATSGSDVGNFVQGFQEGGLWGGIINTVIQALAKVASNLDSFDAAINPITMWFEELSPVLELLLDFIAKINTDVKDLFSGIAAIIEILAPILNLIFGILRTTVAPLRIIGMLLKSLAELLKPVTGFLNSIMESLFGWLDMSDKVNDEKQKELETLKKLNEQYANLSAAIDEQQQYYLEQRKMLNAETVYDLLSNRKVNDMILTPQGRFSTDPNDYIIATKNPQSLGTGFNVVINNTISNRADVTAEQDSTGTLVVKISQKVAQDVITGENGWDTALSYREARLGGRRVTT